ncbi:MAG: hypothetical protein V1775_08205 [Bacteroidota bacterium]
MNSFIRAIKQLFGKSTDTPGQEINNEQENTNNLNQQFNDDNFNNENLTGMARKTVITRVLEVETSDAIIEFPQNRTLLVEQLTDEPPAKAEVVKGLRTMEDVFNKYKPSIKLEFEDMNGQSRKETMDFNELRDFEMDGLIKKSQFLKDLKNQKEDFLKIEKQLRANKVLREAVSDPESKADLIKSLQALLKELQNVK